MLRRRFGMDFDQLLAHWGCYAVALGGFLEGETMLLLGGVAAEQGRLSLAGVMVAGFLGGLAGDQLWFFLARRYGRGLLERRPRWQALAQRLDQRLLRHRDLFILGFRFLYGLRIVSPILIGLGSVSVARYTLLNVIGGIAWAVSVTLLGVSCGHGVDAIVGSLHVSRLQVFAVLVGAVALTLGVRAWWRRSGVQRTE